MRKTGSELTQTALRMLLGAGAVARGGADHPLLLWHHCKKAMTRMVSVVPVLTFCFLCNPVCFMLCSVLFKFDPAVNASHIWQTCFDIFCF